MGEIKQIKRVGIDKLIPYINNAKVHSEDQVTRIASSIREFGFLSPVLIDKDFNVIAGHGRIMAAKKLGMTEVPCIAVEGLSDAQRKAYILADNRLGELADWDMDLVKLELEELDLANFDIDLTGFDINEFLKPGEVVEVDVPDLPEEPKAKVGDIYELGGVHRLICGDATLLSDVQKLTKGLDVDLVVTDPPYNMAYEGSGNTKNRASKRILNDKMPADKFRQFLTDVYTNYFAVMKDGASIYVFYKELGEGVFITAMKDAGLNYKQELIWVKNQLVLGGSKYQSMYEPCLMGCKGKSIKIWNGKRKQRSVIESIDLMNEDELRKALLGLLHETETDIIRENKPLKNDIHPTMKPIKLLAKLISNSSNKGDIVLDLFGGSGSTLMACEQLDRICYTSELDPRYVDVIIERYESFTGKKAVLLNG